MTEVWGELAKSQSDAEKIEEAVTRLISVHESDPEAHLGEGDSLQSHKASEIIDHKLGSILADKFSNNEIFVSTNFDSLDSWTKVGSVIENNFPGFLFYADGESERIIKMYSLNSLSLGTLDFTKNHFFQSLVHIDISSTAKSFFGNCWSNTDTPSEGYGFLADSTGLYGFFYNSHGLQTVEITGITLYHKNVYRAQYDSLSQTVTFYVNGVQKGSITDEGYDRDFDFSIFFYLKSPTDYEAWFSVTSLLVSSEL